MNQTYCLTGGDGQVHASSHRNGLHGDGRVCHPVAVLDPENPERVEQLHALREKAITAEIARIGSAQTVDALQAALREFANPTPQIEEPTGLGAVVEDAAGNLWVRAGRTHGGRLDDNWRVTDGDKVGWWSRWDRIDVARVLSEGVPS